MKPHKITLNKPKNAVMRGLYRLLKTLGACDYSVHCAMAHDSVYEACDRAPVAERNWLYRHLVGETGAEALETRMRTAIATAYPDATRARQSDGHASGLRADLTYLLLRRTRMEYESAVRDRLPGLVERRIKRLNAATAKKKGK